MEKNKYTIEFFNKTPQSGGGGLMKPKYPFPFFFIFGAILLMSATFQQSNFSQNPKSETQKIADDSTKIDKHSGLLVGEGYMMVVAHCTSCHSSKIITQFGADRGGWLEKIRWMQQKQKLWDLGEAEPVILSYLEKYYPKVEKNSRVVPLKKIQWYNLK